MGSRRGTWASSLLSAAFLLCCAAAAEAQGIQFNSGGASYHTNDPQKDPGVISIFCAGGVWNNLNHMRIIIPAGLNLEWDPTIDEATVQYGGLGAANMTAPSSSSITYANGFKTVILQITTNFAGQTTTIQGLRFRNFGAPSSGNIGVNNVGNDTNLINPDMGSTFTILSNPTFSMVGGNQTVNPPGPANCNNLVITDGASPGISNTNGLKVSIPAGLSMQWDPTMTVGIAMSGGTTGNVAPGFSLADGNKTLNLTVDVPFTAGRTVTLSGLRFVNIGNDSVGTQRLFVTTNGAGAFSGFGNQAQNLNTTTILGLPSVTLSSNPRFTTGDAPINAPVITVTASPGSPSKITAASNILLTLPAGISWNTTIDQIGENGLLFGGTAVGALTVALSKITYVDAQNARIELDADFGVGQTLTISNMRFASFNSATPATGMVMTTVLGVSSPQTMAVGAPTILSQVAVPTQGQVFPVDANPALTAAADPILVTDDPQNPAINRITAANDIRIRIPTTPPPSPSLVWDTTVTSVTCTGTAVAATHMLGTAAVTYEDGNKTAVISVNSNWSGVGLAVTISGLVFKDFTQPMTPRQLQLVVNGAGGTTADSDNENIAIGGIPKLDLAANLSFTFADPVTNAGLITVTDAGGVPNITATNNIILRIPDTVPMTWNTARTTRNSGLVINGSGAGHIPIGGATVIMTYSGGGKIATLEVGTDFLAAEVVTIDGMQFQSFTGTHDFTRVQLFTDPGGAPIQASTTIGIGRPNIALQSSQSFGQGDPSTALSQVTITEDAFVQRINAGTGIEIQIPGGLTADWDTTITSTAAGLSFGGTGVGHLSGAPQVTYLSSKIARINIATPFLAGETLTITGLRLMNFSASGPAGLNLEVNNAGTVCRTSVETLSVGTRPQLLSVRTADSNGNGSLDQIVLTFDKNIDPATSSATSGVGFTITSPAYTIGAGAVAGAVVTLTLVEKGTADTGVRPTISYNGTVGNLQELGSGLEISFTGPLQVADGAAPIATGLTASDSDGDGHINTIVITFSEALATGQEDIADWRIIDADGTTNLLQGLTSSAILISGTTVTFTLADVAGTTGTPRYVYVEDAVNPNRIEDLFNNGALLQTNNAPPVVDVGSGIAVGPSKVTLDASRSFDPQGQPLTFSWQQIPPTFPIVNANTATPFFLATTAGNYLFRVTVSNALTSAIGDVPVTILNVPPGADAGSPQTVNPGDNVFLVALASTDANGDTLTFTWSQLPGAAGGASVGAVNPVIPGVANFTAPTPVAGLPTNNILTFEVSVSDGVNTTKAQTQVRLNRSAAQVAPTANAGPDLAATVGSLVTLDGTLSLDPSGGALFRTYKWTSTTPLNNDTDGNPTFTPALPGLYTFNLVVTNPNNQLSSFPDTVQVIVHSATNQAPVAVAHRFKPTGEVIIGDDVVLDATGSIDPEGKPLTYAWTQTAGPKVILADSGALKASFTPVRDALYSFQVVVSDGVNLSRPAPVSVTVKNNPGAITFLTSIAYGTGISPAGVANLSTGALRLNISTTDYFDTWFWYLHQTLGPPATINSNQFSGQLFFPTGTPANDFYTFLPPAGGTYSFRLAATTNGGIRAYADITVVVNDDVAPNNLVPTANAGQPQTVTAGTLVQLDGSASTDDTIIDLGTHWVQREGPPVALSDPFAIGPTFTPVAAGQYTFELTVADGAASSPPSFVVVTVEPAPVAALPTSSSSGGCGFLGLEGLLVLPLIWLASWLLNRLRTRRQAA
jgi:hypothetical protein